MNFLGVDLEESQSTGYTSPDDSLRGLDVNYFKSLQYSVDENSLVGLGFNKVSDSLVDFKPTDTYNEKVANTIIDENFKGIRPEYRQNLIRDSKSEEELKYNAKYALERSANRDYLESLGFVPTLATDMVGSLADIPIIAGVSMVSPFAGASLGATKMRAFATGATLSLGFDTLQDNYGAREISNLEKVLGMAFTGSINSLLTDSYKSVKKDIFNTSMEEHIGLTQEVKDKLSKATTQEEKQKIYVDAYESKKALDESNGNQTIRDTILSNIDKRYESGTLSKGAWSKIRTDMEYMTKTSKSSIFRKFADNVFIDNTLQNNNLNATTIMELKDAYESIGKYILSDNTLKIDRMLSEMKPKKITDYVTPKYLDNSQLYASEILGKMQLLRNNGLVTNDEDILKIAYKEYKALGLSDADANKIASESLKSIKNISNKFGELNLRFKDNSFKPEMKSDSYMTNIYTFSGGEKLIDKGFTKQEMEDYWYGSIKSYIQQNQKEDILRIVSPEKEKALREVARSLNEFLGFKKGVTVGMERDSTKLFQLALENANLTKAERKELASILEGKVKGSNYMQRRMPIDRSYIHIVPNKGNISIMDYVSNDIHEAFSRYAREQSGKIAGQQIKVRQDYVNESGENVFKELDLSSWEGVQLLRSQIVKELEDIRKYSPENLKKLDDRLAKGEITKQEYKKLVKEQTLTDKEYKDEILRFDYVVNSLHGKPTAGLGLQKGEDGRLISISDGTNNINKIQQMMTAINSWRLLGATPFTMVSELHNVARYSTVGGMLNGMKMIPDIMRFYKSGEFKSEAFKEAGNILGFQSDFMHSLRPSMFDGDFSTSVYRSQKDYIDRQIDKGLNISEKMAQFTLHIGGMIPFQTLLQAGAYSGFIKRLEDIASSGGSRGFEKQIIKEAGLTEETAIKLGNLIRQYRGKDGTIGFNKWDEESQMLFTITSKRLMDNIVQKPTIGGKIGLTFNDKLISTSVTGRFALELKQYMYQSYVKQFGKMVESKSMYHYLMQISQAGMITAFMFPEILLKSGGNLDYMEEKMKPENILHETVSRMTTMGMPSMLLGAGSRATLGENIFSPYAGYDRRPLNAFINSTPSADLINTLLMMIPDSTKALFGEEDSSKSLLKDVRKLNTNILPLQFINNYAEGELYGR